MIITRAPFRVSFGGGGSDLPSYYRKFGGCVLSASINKYIYLDIHPFFDERRIQLKYSRTENVDAPGLIQHSIFRCVLDRFHLTGVELTSTADIPGGTGLGSSSSFTVALLQCVYAHLGIHKSKADLASEACEIEIGELGSPIGKQDQYAAAFGGLNFIRFEADDSVFVEPVTLSREKVRDFNSRLVMFYTWVTRDSNEILEQQRRAMDAGNGRVETMHKMVQVAHDMRACLQQGCLDAFGQLLHESWMLKRSICDQISNQPIDELYALARSAGAVGGKILGAGGGGFLLLYCHPDKQPQLKQKLGFLKHFPFFLESGGTQIVYYET
jgi:D-glycero-alpha-D-manno-heptose-7-phosphate kinase